MGMQRTQSHVVGACIDRARIPAPSSTANDLIESSNICEFHSVPENERMMLCHRYLLSEIRLPSTRAPSQGLPQWSFAHALRGAPSDSPPTQTHGNTREPPHSLLWLRHRLVSGVTPLTPRWRQPNALGIFNGFI